MKVLVDTNIMLEVILQRENYNVANQLLTALSEGNHIIYMTVGGFYGMLFTVDKYFKKVMGMTPTVYRRLANERKEHVG